MKRHDLPVLATGAAVYFTSRVLSFRARRARGAAASLPTHVPATGDAAWSVAAGRVGESRPAMAKDRVQAA